jgi:DNA-binding HxlR family transcriptional regulator
MVRGGEMMKQLRTQYGCPVELALEFVGGKWKTVILARLKEAPHRYHELRARLPGVADKVLTERLKDLEQLGLVAKTPINGAGTVSVYQLTERGESLRPVLEALYTWGETAVSELPVTFGPSR